jgi:hypothetical protein
MSRKRLLRRLPLPPYKLGGLAVTRPALKKRHRTRRKNLSQHQLVQLHLAALAVVAVVADEEVVGESRP